MCYPGSAVCGGKRKSLIFFTKFDYPVVHQVLFLVSSANYEFYLIGLRTGSEFDQTEFSGFMPDMVVGVFWIVGMLLSHRDFSDLEPYYLSVAVPRTQFVIYFRPGKPWCPFLGPVAQLGARFNRTEEVAGSNPARSIFAFVGPMAQLGARLNGIEKVAGSSPAGSTFCRQSVEVGGPGLLASPHCTR